MDESGALLVGVIHLGGNHGHVSGLRRMRLFDDEAAADAFLVEHQGDVSTPTVAYWPAGA